MLIDAGVAVAIASDYDPGNGASLNMQSVVSLACLTMGMSPAEATAAATVNAAHALSCAHRIGQLTCDKVADC